MDGDRVRVLSRHFDQLLERNLSLFLDYIIAYLAYVSLFKYLYIYKQIRQPFIPGYPVIIFRCLFLKTSGDMKENIKNWKLKKSLFYWRSVRSVRESSIFSDFKMWLSKKK